MRILVTGGSGSVGKAVVERLVGRGDTVRVIGRRADMTFAGAEYQACDINDFARLREAMRGCAAVVHLAALPSPGKGTPEEIFQINCQGTFNVFQAAAEEGVRRIIQASSINAAGQYFGSQPAPLYYLPLDEVHPITSSDAYSFSKHIIEEIGDYFWRREGIASLAYRLPWVAPAVTHATIGQNRARVQAVAEDLLKRTPEERRAWFDWAWSEYNAFRARRPFETPGLARQLMSEAAEETRTALWVMGHRVNFFTMLDERDSAQAIEKGLAADFCGSHAMFVNDTLNWTGVESRVLAELFYADVNEFKKDISGMQTLVSADRAREMIGFEPEYSFGSPVSS